MSITHLPQIVKKKWIKTLLALEVPLAALEEGESGAPAQDGGTGLCASRRALSAQETLPAGQ